MPLVTTATTGLTSATLKTGIDYSVGTLENQFSESADPTTTGYSAVCTVAWDEADEFLEEMLGRTDAVVGGGMSRVLPEYCPHKPRAYAMSAELLMTTGRGVDDGDGWPTYDQAQYRVQYAVPLYAVLEDDEITYEHERFCVWRKRVVAQNEKIPGGAFKFEAAAAVDQIQLNEVGVKTGRTLELTCKWLDVPVFDYAKISTYCNKINNADVTWDGATYEAETVLFVGADEEPRVNAAGQQTRDINFSFSIRIDGRSWNKFWKATETGADSYVYVSKTGAVGGNRLYETADLNQIWTFTT